MLLSEYPYYKADSIIYVEGWLKYYPVEKQYIQYDKSPLIILNYIKRVGIKSVYKKIISRLSEKNRNKKFYGVGYGRVYNNQNKTFSSEYFLFIGLNKSINWNFIVVPEFLSINIGQISEKIQLDTSILNKTLEEIHQFSAWTSYSGIDIPKELFYNALVTLHKHIRHRPDIKVKLSSESPVFSNEFKIKLNDKKNIITGTIFGLGNYAKNYIIPNVSKYIKVKKIHEIDPDQFDFLKTQSIQYELSTSPIPSKDDSSNVWFIAGYHHTHSLIAIEALRRGVIPVIEKPLASNMKDFERFKTFINSSSKSNYFVCFHRRYSKFNEYLKRDFLPHIPIDFHCIVFEIPLPKNHWYNWPNSGSRLVSNGCHWIDYFLFLNNYSNVVDKKIWNPHDTDLIVQIKLENNAIFNMSLTDKGSTRIGVRDYIELRQINTTVTIKDSEFYFCEKGNRIVRSVRINPQNAYKRMYNEISNRIFNGSNGDSIESLLSTRLTLELEEMLNK